MCACEEEGPYCVVNNVKVCELGNVARVYM